MSSRQKTSWRSGRSAAKWPGDHDSIQRPQKGYGWKTGWPGWEIWHSGLIQFIYVLKLHSTVTTHCLGLWTYKIYSVLKFFLLQPWGPRPVYQAEGVTRRDDEQWCPLLNAEHKRKGQGAREWATAWKQHMLRHEAFNTHVIKETIIPEFTSVPLICNYVNAVFDIRWYWSLLFIAQDVSLGCQHMFCD